MLRLNFIIFVFLGIALCAFETNAFNSKEVKSSDSSLSYRENRDHARTMENSDLYDRKMSWRIKRCRGGGCPPPPKPGPCPGGCGGNYGGNTGSNVGPGNNQSINNNNNYRSNLPKVETSKMQKLDFLENNDLYGKVLEDDSLLELKNEILQKQNDLISSINVKHNMQNAVNAHCEPAEEDVSFIIYDNGTLTTIGLRSNNLYSTLIKNPEIFIHDWLQDYSHNYEQQDISSNYNQIVTSYKNRRNESEKLIFVDWGKISQCEYSLTVQKTIPAVGQIVAKFISQVMIRFGTDIKNIHLIGHGMGAQIASIAAKKLASDKLGKIGRITGLDPAGPGYNLETSARRLDKSDADFVDVIYTNMNFYGIWKEVGHANFYPNGGDLQKGCAEDHLCNHHRALTYFLESLYTSWEFEGLKCNNYMKFEMQICPVPWEYAVMGEYANSSTRGRYFLDTHMYPPFPVIPPVFPEDDDKSQAYTL